MAAQTATQVCTFRASNRHLRVAALGMGVVMTVLVLVVAALTIRDWNGVALAVTGGLIATFWLVSLPLAYLLLSRSQRGLCLHVGPEGVCRQHGAVRQLVPWAAITRVRVRNPWSDPDWVGRRANWDEAEKHPRAGWLFRAFARVKPGPTEPISVEVDTAEGRALYLTEFERLSEIARLIEAGVGPGVAVDKG